MFEDHSTSTSTGADRPGIEESYEVAINTSDLSLVEHRRGAADILIAAAWSESRLGGALLRLHSEWNACEKPIKPSKEAVKALTGTFQRALPGDVQLAEGEKRQPLTAAQASQYVSTWYAHELALVLQKLKELPAVRAQVTLVAAKWGMEAAETKAAAVLRYWLEMNCTTCHGRKFRQIPGTPSLSNKACSACGGSGVAQVPHGQEGRKLANHLDACVHRARQGIRNRLRTNHG